MKARIYLTEEALEFMDGFLSTKQKYAKSVRIGVKAKHNCFNLHSYIECAQYKLDKDIIMSVKNNIKIFIDPDDFYILNGATLVLVKSEIESGLKFKNAKRLCPKFACR